MLDADTTSAAYWKKCGDDALAHGVKGLVVMVGYFLLSDDFHSNTLLNSHQGAHWDCAGDNKIKVATNPTGAKQPSAFVRPESYLDWKANPDLATAERCVSMLREAGFNASEDPNFVWIHDVYLILIRMFPDSSKCPPTTIISMNAGYDPWFHTKMGEALRPLRHEGYLFIGTGGAVHNLYRNRWSDMLLHRESLGQEVPPEMWALDFRQATEDVITKNSGPRLRAALIRLMRHPRYRDAHGTEEHWIPALFCAGAAGTYEDVGSVNVLGAETWELSNMCNSQYTLGCYNT
jgi:aromatic ring-opening dioxygenase catalytic subunit (LigB family)